MEIFKGKILVITKNNSLVVFDDEAEYQKTMKTNFRKDVAWFWGSPAMLKKHLDSEQE